MTQIPGDITPQIITRLKKVQGQLGGVVRMIEEGRDTTSGGKQSIKPSRIYNSFTRFKRMCKIWRLKWHR